VADEHQVMPSGVCPGRDGRGQPIPRSTRPGSQIAVNGKLIRLRPVRQGRWRIRRFTVLLAVAGLAAAGCAAAPSQVSGTAGQGSVVVSRARGGSLNLAGGLQVSLPAGSVARAGRLTGAVVRAPAAAPAGLAFAGGVYRLRVTGTKLTGRAQLTLPVPALRGKGALAGPDVALLAYYDASAGRWQPVPAVYHPASRTITATSAHLSVWTVLRIDTGKILAAAASALKGFIGVASTTAQPSCPGASQLAADGITVTSDKGSLVRWCAGTAGTAAPLLQVADNRSFAVQADYPRGWSLQRLGSAGPVTDQIITSVARALSPAANGQASAIIPGGHTVQFAVPAGASGEVLAAPSSEGYLIDALLYGADTLGMTFDGIPGVPRSNPSATARAISGAFTVKDCLTQMDALSRGDVSTARSAGELFRDDVGLAVGCLGEQWTDAYGITGFIGDFVAKVVLWLADGIKLVINGLQAAIDSGIYWRGYRIAVSATAPSVPAQYTGTWYGPVQGLELLVNPDGRATLLANGESCGKPGGQSTCTDSWSISFTARSGATSLHGVVISNTGSGMGNETGDPVTLSLTPSLGVVALDSPIGDGAGLCQLPEISQCPG
jgi:hypothetical protein